jgi:Holliday junction resolvase
MPISMSEPAESGAQDASSLTTSGVVVGEVRLEIDYQIIEHFSEHLYASPNKAVEELVANGFDAYASQVYVYTPGRFTPDHVLVWDDGWSMDIPGLQDMWVIAASPKERVGRVARGPRGERNMIGKFGIGKLASYSVGRTVSHLCRRDDEFLLVTIDYGRIHEETTSPSGKMAEPKSADSDMPNPGGEQWPPHRRVISEPIRKLSEAEARAAVGDLFANVGVAIHALFDTDRWTLAIIGSLKTGSLTAGRLGWVLGNGMPLRPDFKVWLNDQPVTPKLEQGITAQWSFADSALQETLKVQWADAVRRGDVRRPLDVVSGDSFEPRFGTAAGLDPAHPEDEVGYVELPYLGRVWGTVTLFDHSVFKNRASDQGRSHGFFFMVRGRLINPDDDVVFLHDPSYGTFYRTQIVVHADGLDAELLADRENVRRSGPRPEVLTVLQQALYRLALREQDKRDDELAARQDAGAYLPTFSREHFRAPLSALLVREAPGVASAFDAANPTVQREDVGEDESLAVIAPDGKGFQVNTSHPYYRSLESSMGRGKKAREFLRFYDLIAVYEQLFVGFLYDLGIPDEKIQKIVSWRDGAFRTLARLRNKAPSELARNLEDKSHVSGREFEDAIVAVLEGMGFLAERDGAPGKKDVLLVAPCGPRSYTLTVEAKAKAKGSIANDEAEVSGAGAHRQGSGAEFAIIVARRFAGFDRSGDAMILQECRDNGRVAIMEVEALVRLLYAVRRFAYPLDIVKDVFVQIESPAAKLERIHRLEHPVEDFDYGAFLGQVWKRQAGAAMNDVVAYRTIWQDSGKKLPWEVFQQKVLALGTVAQPLVHIDSVREHVTLLQSPDIIMDLIEARLVPELNEE